MENWLRESGKSALFETLNEAWGRLEDDYQSACHAENIRVAGLEGEIQILKARVSKVDWLESQNKTLKAELDQVKRSSHKQQDRIQNRPEPRTPLAPLSVNNTIGLVASTKRGSHIDPTTLGRDELDAEFTKLKDKYQKARDQVTLSHEVNETLKKQLRDTTQAYREWQQHANNLQVQIGTRNQKIKKLKTQLAAVNANDATVNTSFTRETPSAVGGGSDATERPPERTCSPHPGAPVLLLPETTGDANGTSVCESTEDTDRAPSLPPLPVARNAAATRQVRSEEPSSDTPVIYAERSVHKRRRNDDLPSYTPAATRIKREEGSDPIMTSEYRRFAAQESMDFDNAEETVATPRKLKVAQSAARTSRHTSIRGATPSHRQDSTPAEEQLQDTFDSQGSMSADVQEREQEAAEWKGTVFHDEYTEQMDYEEPANRSSTLPVYDVAKPKPVARKPNSKASIPMSLHQGIASLAEDGNITESKSNRNNRPAAKTGRLANLLEHAASPEREVITPPSARTHLPSSHHDFHFTMPEKRILPFGQPDNKVSKSPKTPETPLLGSSKKTTSAVKVNKNPLGAPEKSKSKKEIPLRERPLWSLKRGDFKLNPKYNEGYDFAFGEVVRGKERASLPGCSKEACCGKVFRPLAENALAATDHIAFISYLEQQLEDEAWKLGSMSKEEKEKMWIDAKIREMSQQHGRHRERHGAMAEPPGWDRLGFPSTQEDAEDREAANQLELSEVELRHREAMKKGKYLFRDEEA